MRSNTPQGGLLQITTERRNGLLCIRVLDDGPGAKPGDLEGSNGFGLRVARQRLMTRYGDQASFRLETWPGKGFSVRMEIPVKG
jgi:sensor histidine kinase YesM